MAWRKALARIVVDYTGEKTGFGRVTAISALNAMVRKHLLDTIPLFAVNDGLVKPWVWRALVNRHTDVSLVRQHQIEIATRDGPMA